MSWLPSSFPNPFFQSCSSNTFIVLDGAGAGARCDELSNPSTTTFIISCGLIAWTLASYIPQYARIVRRQSAEGLSTLYILLGASSGVCAVANILILPSSQVDIECCKINDAYPCIASLLGMLQVINGVACFWGVMFLYVYYAREEAEADRTGRRSSLSSQMRTYRRARKAWIVLFAVIAWTLLISLASIIVLYRLPQYAQSWADFLGVLVAALACTQWLPQIITTWDLGHLGSLSVAMLALSTPATWIFAFSLITRVGFEGWSAWIVYVLVGSMQLILIATAILFAIRDCQHGKPGINTIETGMQENAWIDPSSEEEDYMGLDDGSMTTPDERTSLLSGITGKKSLRAKGSLSRYLGFGLQQHIQNHNTQSDEDPFGKKDPFNG